MAIFDPAMFNTTSGTESSVSQAQAEMQKSMNKASVSQMQTAAKSAAMGAQNAVLGQTVDLMNSQKQISEKVRL